MTLFCLLLHLCIGMLLILIITIIIILKLDDSQLYVHVCSNYLQCPRAISIIPYIHTAGIFGEH